MARRAKRKGVNRQVGMVDAKHARSILKQFPVAQNDQWDRPKRGKTQDHTRTITFNAIGNPYNVLIGVSGPKGATAGGFTLKVDLK